MKYTIKLALLAAGICLCFGLYCCQNITINPEHPIPTDGTIVLDGQIEDEDNANRREQYFELMHRTAPDTDWRAIDSKTRKKQYKEKRSLRKLKSSMTTEVFGNGALEGEWFERGSINQSGSITAVDYDVDSDKIYLISAGGTVWKGDRTSSNWTPQNEDLQFDTRFIKVIDNATGGKRLLASIDKIIHYSDNEGVSWQSSGISFSSSWGNPHSMYVMSDNTVYYLAPSGSQMWLFRSTDRGLNFTQIHTFINGNSSQTSMWSPHDSDELYILDRSTTLYEVTGATVSTLNTNTNLPTGVDNQLKGHKSGNTLRLYALTDRKDIYKSTNSGASWTLQGTLPESAWDVGIEVSLDDPDRLYAGAVNSYRSFNGGTSWTMVNGWAEYYNDVTNKLHADIMAFGSFYDPTGAEFTLIANHGGISISYDNMVTNTNIALQNLNVSQYYDVVTSEADVNYMYAGTQDQGFQRTNMAAGTSIANWEQQISGDYGHMIFSNNGQSLWTQYVFGEVRHYANPRTGNSNALWVMTGNDRPSHNWLLPTAETPDPTDNSIYIGGGNINTTTDASGNIIQEDGNYLITLTYAGGSITATQGTFNFKASADNNGQISAIEASTLDANRLYVAMDDGTFFYSNDLGGTWSKTSSFAGPGNWYLYGATILASDVTSNLVYYGGSGYSNPAVYKSTNGGQTFTPMNNGLPNTLVHELAANADESLLFAATEVGPYVYVIAQNQWFDMRGVGAPMQRYTSVEYIESEDVVRFGTYGRGAWDFNVSDDSACTDTDNDGVCAADDCDDNDATIPTTPGTPCDDGNPNTTNDLIIGDGCICQGSTTPPSANYCIPNVPTNSNTVYIYNVNLEQIDYDSGNEGYGDFTSTPPAYLSPSGSHTLYAYKPVDADSKFYWRVWIDYNQDGDFDDTDELVIHKVNQSDYYILETFTVPANAPNGATRMRIHLKEYIGNPPDPCGNNDNIDAEIEDYTVIIGADECEPFLDLSGTISPNIYKAADYIESDGQVLAGNNVTFQAGNLVHLLPGFIATAGTSSMFHAFIDDCTPTAPKEEIAESEPIIRNYPNPFTGQTTIEFTLPQDSDVTLFVADAMGRQVEILMNHETSVAGTHQVIFDGNQHAAGMYYYTIQAGEYTATQKMILIK